MAVTEYIAQENERWDTIAYKAYGDASKYPEIIAQNPDVPITDVLPAGTKLYVPVQQTPQLDKNLMPPWKR